MVFADAREVMRNDGTHGSKQCGRSQRMHHRLDAIKTKDPREPTVGDQHRKGAERRCARSGPAQASCV